MKVYIAAPFFSDDQINIVESVEDALLAGNIDFYSPRGEGILSKMSISDQNKTKGRIFKSNIDSMDACTHMVACVEHKDSGTTFEIGYFFAKQKPIVLFSEKIETINVMLAEAAISLCDINYKIVPSLYGEYSTKPKSLT